jgi:hypothetical protein
MSASERLPNMLASASWDTCTKVWDLRTNGAVCTLKVRRPKVKIVSNFARLLLFKRAQICADVTKRHDYR